ncbi:MAG TPA: 50S ribosomal protein L18 [Candidatus Paceibacterota bacterium]|jgi:large subunit ribosomal protein L18|nr:50S ribosomal protein L18 [Candidatus Paceibacterota bacterium]HPT40045.1 50S ribosomal protein L18 [Candidatus Paceibacterota bacterium]
MAISITKIKREKRIKRHRRIKATISGTRQIPRLSVFRSNKHIYAQLINDSKGIVLASASDKEIKTKGKKVDIAKSVGELIAKKAKDLKINKTVFDRGGFQYHGRVKNLADGAREAGLKF